jgi:hypothetical protein
MTAADLAGTEAAGADRGRVGVGVAELGTAMGGAADGVTVTEFAVLRVSAALAACPPPLLNAATAPPIAATTTRNTAPAMMPVRKLISSSQALIAALGPE